MKAPSRWSQVRDTALDVADEVLCLIGSAALLLWAGIEWLARSIHGLFGWAWRKLGRVGQVLVFWLPIFCALVMFALNVAGIEYADQRAYLIELAPRSVYVLAIIGLAAAFMAVSGMDVANRRRCELQDLISGKVESGRRAWLGAIAILGAESIVWCFALWQVGRLVLELQG